MRNWPAWVEHRFGLDLIKESFLFRRVPKTSWYQGDGAALMLLLAMLVTTGMFMTPVYSPTPETAYQSVEYITDQLVLGWYVRAMHYWSAGMMVVMLVFHLFRLILIGGYKAPREGNWLVGVVMFFLVLTMSFTGYVLRWDERGIYGLRVAMTMFYRLPWIGDELVVLIQGGREMGAQTLTRVYAVHVIFVPALLVMLAGYHLYLAVVRGVTSKAERDEPVSTAAKQEIVYDEAKRSAEEGETFHPTTTAKSGLMGFVLFLIVLGLVLVVGPAPLMSEADLVERSMPGEEWWFWWYSALIALLPPWVARWFVVVFPLAVLVVLVALPFVDRGPDRGMRKRPVAVASVVVMVVALLYLTDLRRRSPWTAWPDQPPPPAPAGVDLAPGAEQGRLLFAAYGCSSCHAVAGAGRQVGPDLARLSHRMSAQELFAYISEPPADVAMPAYGGWATPEDLNRLVEYVLAAQTFPREQDAEAGR